ncbi:hypothetical protein D3C76_1669230 [compost metagenome]
MTAGHQLNTILPQRLAARARIIREEGQLQRAARFPPGPGPMQYGHNHAPVREPGRQSRPNVVGQPGGAIQPPVTQLAGVAISPRP